MNKIRFILGEDKHVKLLVRSPNDEPFTILTASYELARYTDIVVQGECDINGHYLDCKIAPKEKRNTYIGSNVHGCGFDQEGKDRSRGGLMLKITDVKLSKNTVATGEKFTISVQIQETVDYPYDYPYDYPISYTGTAKPVNS